MIKSIKLENWRSHHKSEFYFGHGTNVLVGRMGAGKSSVMDAICFALYGTFPALKAKRVSLEETIMNKPNEMSSAKVRMEFNYNGQNYFVEREIKRNGTTVAKLFCNERLIAGPKTTDVSAEIEKILEMDYELFSRAVYSEQNQIDYFLRLNPSQRKEKFDELLGINKYESVRANAVSVLNRLKKVIEDKEKWLMQQSATFDKNALLEYRKKLQHKKENISEIEKEINKRTANLNEIEKMLVGEELKEKKANELKERQLTVTAKIESISKRISEIEGALEKKSLPIIKKEILEIEEEIKRNQESYKKIDLEIEKLQNVINSLLAEIEANEKRLIEIKKILSTLKEAKAKCPVCKSELSTEMQQKLIFENEEEIKRITNKNEKNENEIKRLKKEINSAREEKTKVENLIEKKQLEKMKLNELIETASMLEKYITELKKLETEKTIIEKEINELSFDNDKIKKLREQYIAEKSKIESLRGETLSLKEMIIEIENSIAHIEKIEKLIETTKKEVENTKFITEKLSIFINALKAAQAELRQAMIETINEAMDDLWQRLYPYGDFKSAKISISGDSYEILVQTRNGSWLNAEGVLSGGERSTVAITLRIAISLVLAQNLGWLVLDEPTHNLDSVAVNVLCNIMKEHLPLLVEQIFIITHDKQLENAATASLYILDRDKENDGTTRIITELKD